MSNVSTHLLDRLGLERRDGRNLLLTAGIMTVLLFSYVDGPLQSRLLAAVIGGFVAATVFTVVTILINKNKPDHW